MVQKTVFTGQRLPHVFGFCTWTPSMGCVGFGSERQPIQVLVAKANSITAMFRSAQISTVTEQKCWSQSEEAKIVATTRECH